MKKLFIIHGWTYSVEAWNECLAALKQYQIEPVMLKVPGLTVDSTEVWNVEKYVAWLEAKLKNETNVVLAGHSNGGRIAIAYAARRPQKLKQLILIDAAGIVHNEWPLRLKRAVFGSLAKLAKTITKSGFIRKVYYRLIGARDYERANPIQRQTMRNLITTDLTTHLQNITVPTLIVWGRNDTATPVQDAFRMNRAIIGSKLHVIDNAGHSPHKTHPNDVATLIAQWLDHEK